MLPPSCAPSRQSKRAGHGTSCEARGHGKRSIMGSCREWRRLVPHASDAEQDRGGVEGSREEPAQVSVNPGCWHASCFTAQRASAVGLAGPGAMIVLCEAKENNYGTLDNDRILVG